MSSGRQGIAESFPQKRKTARHSVLYAQLATTSMARVRSNCFDQLTLKK
jgi:hypothetical protein